MLNQIKVIGFDADDTLWVNEPFYQDVEKEFLMVGNSVKSDILPVINIGAKAIHIPFEVTWQHESNHASADNEAFITVSEISDILNLLQIQCL